MEKYDALKLRVQLCFPLYACAREAVKLYTPYLNELDLTYTQYIAMLVLWEYQEISAREMGRLLYLDSGTLTPVLKSLESKGLITRCRSKDDERVLIVTLTEAGLALRDDAVGIPKEMTKLVNLSKDEAHQLYDLLYKLLAQLD